MRPRSRRWTPRRIALLLGAVAVTALVLFVGMARTNTVPVVALGEALESVRRGEVEKIETADGGQAILFTVQDGSLLRVSKEPAARIADILAANGIDPSKSNVLVVVERPAGAKDASLLYAILGIVFSCLPLILVAELVFYAVERGDDPSQDWFGYR